MHATLLIPLYSQTMSTTPKVPNHEDLTIVTLRAIHALGGSARIGEIVSAVISREQISDEIANKPHKGNASQTELEYRLSWARTVLKNRGYLENSTRGVWTLTAKAKTEIAENTLPSEAKLFADYNTARPASKNTTASSITPSVPQSSNAPDDQQGTSDESNDGEEWRVQLSNVLQNIDPFAFERLCRRLLLEAGFLNVENTRSTGDGGFDGSGRMQINELVNVNAIFECKRYANQVGPDVVRRLRGTMQGKADYALLIVTSNFSVAAKTEAAHSAGGRIELIDGERLAELLQKYELGIKTEMVEQVTVDAEWFSDL